MPAVVAPDRLHDGFLGQRAFGSLDGLRALSILAVIWIHTHPGFAWVATRRGLLGVDLFFVISGFLIVTLLRRERRRTASISLRAFYTRRALRIFPLFYGLLLLALVFAPWIDRPDGAALRADLPWAALYLANWVPLRTHLSLAWSLSTEEQFYFCWPIVEKWTTAHRPLVLLLAAMIGMQLAHAHADFWPTMPRAFAETGFTPILFGVGLAHLCDERRSYSLLRRWLGHRAAAPSALLLVLAAASLPGGEPWIGWPRLALQFSLALLVATCVVREDHALAPLLGWRPLARLGKVSYGAYLLHMPARHFVYALTERDWPQGGLVPFAGTIALTWLAAEVSYRCYEAPFLRLKERWSRAAA